MTIYTLYVKTHNETGLKYLGQTSKEPFKYCGSGVDWEKHLQQFGKDIHTEILLRTHNKDERNYWGRYYSTLWNVVGAMDDFGNKIWANRIPETGSGAGNNGKNAGVLVGEKNPRFNPTRYTWQNIKTDQIFCGTTYDLDLIVGPGKGSSSKVARGTRIMFWDWQLVDAVTHAPLKVRKQYPEHIVMPARPELAKKMKGAGNGNADKTVYTWYNSKLDQTIHATQIEFKEITNANKCSVSQVARGTQKSTLGWVILPTINTQYRT
jgi:hypothetical protein